jgi:hypothetical protein
VRLEGLGQLKKKSNGLIGIRSRDLPACSIIPQPATQPRASGNHQVRIFTVLCTPRHLHRPVNVIRNATQHDAMEKCLFIKGIVMTSLLLIKSWQTHLCGDKARDSYSGSTDFESRLRQRP